MQVYRIINKIDNISFDTFFTYNTQRTRGHDLKLEKPGATNNIRVYGFSHRVIDIWNSLGDATVNAPSINAFKNAIEKEWKNDPLKYNDENIDRDTYLKYISH